MTKPATAGKTAKRRGAIAPKKPNAATDQWDVEARRIIKAELEAQGVTLPELADRLAALGETDNEKSLWIRINRGTFPLSFALKVFAVLGVELVVKRTRTRQ